VPNRKILSRRTLTLSTAFYHPTKFSEFSLHWIDCLHWSSPSSFFFGIFFIHSTPHREKKRTELNRTESSHRYFSQPCTTGTRGISTSSSSLSSSSLAAFLPTFSFCLVSGFSRTEKIFAKIQNVFCYVESYAPNSILCTKAELLCSLIFWSRIFFFFDQKEKFLV
jgi:hypothetical protein